MAELITDTFIINGTQHEYAPEEFTTVRDSTSSKQESVETLNGKRIRLSRQAQTTLYNPLAYNRSDTLQLWNGAWVAMSREMYDQLLTLYTLDATFFIQFDDEMSRDIEIDQPYGNDFAKLRNFGNDYRTFLTPTYPIKPYGDTPFVPEVYAYTIFIDDGSTMYALQEGFVVDEEQGIVKFNERLAVDVEVYMKYTWRAKVRIAELQLVPLEDVALQLYSGQVLFEQMPLSGREFQPWNVESFTSTCTFGETTVIPSYTTSATIPTDMEYDATGNGNGDPDGTDVCDSDDANWVITETWSGTTSYYDPVTDTTTNVAWLADGSNVDFNYNSASAITNEAAYVTFDGTVQYDFNYTGLLGVTTLNVQSDFSLLATGFAQASDPLNPFYTGSTAFATVQPSTAVELVSGGGLDLNFAPGVDTPLTNGESSVTRRFLPNDAAVSVTYTNSKTYALAYDIGASVSFDVFGKIDVSIGEEPGFAAMAFSADFTTTISTCDGDYDDSGSDGSGGNQGTGIKGADYNYVDAQE